VTLNVNEHLLRPLTVHVLEPLGTETSYVTTLGPLVEPSDFLPALTESDSDGHENESFVWLAPDPLVTVKVFDPPFWLRAALQVEVCVVAGGVVCGVVVVDGTTVVVVVDGTLTVVLVVVVGATVVVVVVGATVVVETVPPLPTGRVGAETAVIAPTELLTLTATRTV
jgi:hypothetical protein